MSCTNPMRAFDTGYLTENGKPLYYITKKKLAFIRKPINADVANSQRPQHVWQDILIKEFTEIPCGKCQSCRLDYSKEWMQRCMLEQKLWAYNEMITLTYDEEHLPKQIGANIKENDVNFETGEINPETKFKEVPTLKKDDVQKFLKRLRRYWQYNYGQDNIRFYMCGEYGDQKGRPHYHLLMFNFEVHDKEFYKYSKKGFKMYHSQVIEDLWGKGHIELNEVNAETCAYVARYIMKKQKGGNAKELAELKGQVPEYTNCSRKPGIGGNYFEEHKEQIYSSDKIYINTGKGLDTALPSKYFDRLYDAEEHDLMEKIKARRKELAEQRQATQVMLSGLSPEKIREYKANALRERIKKLQRSGI